jgi:membrane-associated phospholipid phosphatase
MKKFLVFIITAVIGISSQAQSLDYQIIYEANVDDRPKFLDKPFQFISNSTGAVTFGVPISMMAAGLFTHNKDLLKQGEQAGIALGVSTISTWVLKETFRRERPFIRHTDLIKLSGGGGPSLPSGHASTAFAIATSVSMSYKKWYVVVPAFTWASLVGYSRIDLGVHYPSDVIIGAAVGVGSAFAARKINRWLHKEKPTLRTVALSKIF